MIFLRDSRASETRARAKITPPRVAFSRVGGDFHARSRFARSTIPEEKWGTTRSLTGIWSRVLDMRAYLRPKPEKWDPIEGKKKTKTRI